MTTKVKGKVVVVGEFSVGKTCLSHRFITKTFTGLTEPTIGAAFQVRTVSLNPQTSVTLEVWDTAGSERYRSLMPMYYRDAAGCIVVYDITNAKTFERCSSWIDDFRRHNENASDVLMVLAGTKLDLANTENKREVDRSEAEAFAKREGLTFFETSAKTDVNVEEVFMVVADHIVKRRELQDRQSGGSSATTPKGGKRNGGGRVDLREAADDLDFYSRRKKKEQDSLANDGKRCSC